MHEVSLGGMLTDYLSGAAIEETTYEEFRQALARYLVEEKGYPKSGLAAKVPLAFRIDGEETGRHIDLVASDETGRPLVLVIFCTGDVGSFERETVSCARLFPGGPVPIAIASDSIGASVMRTATGDPLFAETGRATGVNAIPTWAEVQAIDAATPRVELTPERRAREERILHAYSGFCTAPVAASPAAFHPRVANRRTSSGRRARCGFSTQPAACGMRLPRRLTHKRSRSRYRYTTGVV